MRPSQKMALIGTVARELQSRYTFVEIHAYLAEVGISTPHEFSNFGSKAVYVKTTLRGVQAAALSRIVEDLEIKTPAARTFQSPRVMV